MKSNSCLCVHKYIYAIEGFLSVQTIHIFIELFNFYVFKQETFCAQGKKRVYSLNCTVLRFKWWASFRKRIKGLLALLGKNGLIFILIWFIEKHFLLFDVVYAKWKHHALPIRIMQEVTLSFAWMLQKEIACMAGRYPWY